MVQGSQDILLVSDCCGDTCGYVTKPGTPYQMHVQTSGGSGSSEASGGAELVVFCLEDMEGFRAKVLAAKRSLISPAGASGASKVESASAMGDERVVAVLERMERALNDNLTIMRSTKASSAT